MFTNSSIGGLIFGAPLLLDLPLEVDLLRPLFGGKTGIEMSSDCSSSSSFLPSADQLFVSRQSPREDLFLWFIK